MSPSIEIVSPEPVASFSPIAEQLAQVEEMLVVADRFIREALTARCPSKRRDASAKATQATQDWHEARQRLRQRCAARLGITVDQLKRICA